MIKGIRPCLAEAGKIKIGGLGKEQTSKRSGKKFRSPQKYTSFAITTNRRDANGDLEIDADLMASLEKDPDGKIRAIPIVLHSDDIDLVFPTAYAMYSGKQALCVGDGDRAERWNKNHTEKECVACPCDRLNATTGLVCKPHGTLHCSVRSPNRAVAGALHRWRTTSMISIQRMIGSLQQILATVGVLRGIPLMLKIEPVRVAPNGVASTVYCCHVELHAKDILDVQRKAIEEANVRKALAGEDYDRAYKALVAHPGIDETPEVQAETAEEFYPEQVDADYVEPEEDVPDSGAEKLMSALKQLDGVDAGEASS